jgi:serine/threonine protein kinase
MAPEQAMGRASEIDGRTDVWSVGATIFTLLSGRTVHQAESQSELLLMAATRRAPSLREAMPRATAPLVDLVDRALAFERDARWASAEAMRDAVRAAYREAFGRIVGPVALLRGLLAESAPPPEREEDTLRDALVPSERVVTAPVPAAAGILWTLRMTERPRQPDAPDALVAGSTTAPPVSSEQPFQPARPSSIPPRTPRRWPRAAAAALVPVAIVGLLLSAFRFTGQDERRAPAKAPPAVDSVRASPGARDASLPDAP